MPLESSEPWLLRLLAVVRTRPGMWIPGPETVENLETYLIGYRQARGDLGLPPYGEGEEDLLDRFERWLKRRLKTEKELGWSMYVTEIDDGPKNVVTFFRLFDEFLEENDLGLPAPEDAGWPADTWGIHGYD